MLIIFSILIPISLSLTPEWNLSSSGVELLSSKDTYEYVTYSNTFDGGIELKMKRRITRLSNGNIEVKKIISLGKEEKEVPSINSFDNIQSSHNVSGNVIICPYGGDHPYNYSNLERLKISGTDDDQFQRNWDLKCIYHKKSKIFFVVYSRKTPVYIFYTKNINKNYWNPISTGTELYDYKLSDKLLGNENNEIPIIFYSKIGKEGIIFSDNNIVIGEKYIGLKSKNLLNTSLTTTKGFMKNNTNNFYFVSYNDTKIFYTGYINTTVDDDFHYINSTVKYNNNSSPFNFSSEVTNLEIDFIFRNKFIYYRLVNENKYYHGIIDIELHKIIFNTKEIINKFIPYSDKAMLAITPDKAYIICAYKIDGNCTDYCPGGNYIINPNGNTCGLSCDDNQYRFISDNTCIDNCNENIYIIYKENDEKKCGMCKDFYKDKPYKFINGTNCYSSIPEGAIIKDNISNLMECDEKEGYYFENETCYKKINCFHSCKECSEESITEYDQKCTKCKDNYVFQNGNCLNNCSERYGIIDGECQECKDTSCDIFYINSCNCSKCKEHFYLIENNCLECDENCENCFSESNNCTSCNTSSFLFNGQCLSCTPCNEKEDNSCKCLSCSMGHFLQNGRCQKCSDNCQLCENITYCNSCEIGYALNINNNTCSRCHNNCESCSSPSINDTEQNCLSCNNNLFLYENNCVEECKDGLYTNEQNKICEKCNEHCKTCDEGGEPNDEHCSSCDINSTYKYLVNATGFPKNCVIECPNGTIENNEICVLKKQEPEPEPEQEQEPEQEKKKEKEQETQGNEKNEKNYSAVIISTSVVGGVIIIAAVILIVYFCHKRRKKNINFDEDENELMKNMGAEMEQL